MAKITDNICLKYPEFSSILCDFPWLFQSVQNSLTFPWLENAFSFSHFSSLSRNPDRIAPLRLFLYTSETNCIVKIEKYIKKQNKSDNTFFIIILK